MMGDATWTLSGPPDLPSASPLRSERLPIIRFVRGYRDGDRLPANVCLLDERSILLRNCD
jgi:hypothetical protein